MAMLDTPNSRPKVPQRLHLLRGLLERTRPLRRRSNKRSSRKSIPSRLTPLNQSTSVLDLSQPSYLFGSVLVQSHAPLGRPSRTRRPPTTLATCQPFRRCSRAQPAARQATPARMATAMVRKAMVRTATMR